MIRRGPKSDPKNDQIRGYPQNPRYPNFGGTPEIHGVGGLGTPPEGVQKGVIFGVIFGVISGPLFGGVVGGIRGFPLKRGVPKVIKKGVEKWIRGWSATPEIGRKPKTMQKNTTFLKKWIFRVFWFSPNYSREKLPPTQVWIFQ